MNIVTIIEDNLITGTRYGVLEIPEERTKKHIHRQHEKYQTYKHRNIKNFKTRQK